MNRLRGETSFDILRARLTLRAHKEVPLHRSFIIRVSPRLLVAGLSLTALLGAAFGPALRPAGAFPPYTKKEEKPCGYCHTNPKGGGKRNYRGAFYKANNLTFANFDDAAEAKKAGEEIGPEPTPPPKSYTPPAGATPPATTPPPVTTPPVTPPVTETPVATTPKPTPKPAAKPTTAALKAKMTAAAAAYKKAPKSAAAKKAYAASLANLAHATMLDQSIPPRTRYPSALKMANQALKLDPTNKTAKDDKKAIESAYKSMGRPVPKV